MVLEIGGKCSYSCCFVGCCFQDSFSMAYSIFMKFPSSFFFIRLVGIHVVHPYGRIDTTTTWKKLCFISLDGWDFHMINNLWIVVCAFASCILMSFSVNEMLLLRYVNLSTKFRESPFWVKMSPFWLKHIYFIFVCIDMEANVTCCLLQTMQLGFGLSRCICQNRYVICVHYSLCGVPSASCLFLV